MNGAQSVFQRREEPHEHNPDSIGADGNGGCSRGDTHQRDELLAKIANGNTLK
jgi:hypothetical protein